MSRYFSFLLAIVCFCFMLPRSEMLSLDPGCTIFRQPAVFNPRYFQDGDIILGGIITVQYHYATSYRSFETSPRSAVSFCSCPVPDLYQHVLAFIYAINEINRNPNILPNITLGYHLYDSCGHVNNAIESVLRILSGSGALVPNFSCKDRGKLAGVVGDLYSETSLHIAQMVNLYGYSQISHGATDPVFINKEVYPFFFQTLPNDNTQYLAIVKLLIHFGWTWIGVAISDDDSGETQSREFRKIALAHGICTEFILKIPTEMSVNRIKVTDTNKFNIESTSKILVICGRVTFLSMFFLMEYRGISLKTLIIPASCIFHIHLAGELQRPLNGSLLFTRPRKVIRNLKEFLDSVTVGNRPKDLLLQHIFLIFSSCLTSDPSMNHLYEFYLQQRLHKCNTSMELGTIDSLIYNTNAFKTTYHVYKAAYALAQSLHDMQSFFYTYFKDSRVNSFKHKQKYFLRRVHFQDPTGEEIYFNEKGEMATHYDIQNFYISSPKVIFQKSVGTFNISAIEGRQLDIGKRAIVWKNGEFPLSKCSEDCPKGYKRVTKRGIHLCCFHCVQCSEGEISIDTDQYSCKKCPEDMWPDEKKNHCIPKPVEYLSYRTDPVAQIVSFFSVLFSVKASIILGIFLLFRDTPVVKANNQNLSFILLVSVTFSFLCVLLFIGRPVQATCMLRQTSFGIIFSVAISCILAKTITVYVAFRTTRPGSSWRKLMGVKIPNCVVLICSCIQVFISIVWLSTVPPFEESDTHSYAEKIIIQCNEGSLLAFYVLLGYMGFLAFVSFIVAFLARNLPDRFNEAKNITFSMLVFCSVWTAFIPAYMSIMGKNTVLVEIFAILSSSIGILGCIFFPKCYILLLRPNLNVKNNMMRAVKGRH